MIEAQLENGSRIDIPNNKATNNAQETNKVSQSTLKYDDIESKGSAEQNTSNSVNNGSMTSRPALMCTPPPHDHQQFPIYRRLSTDISALKKAEEVQLQNQCLNTLTVCGLPIRRGDRKSLLGLFKILSDHIFEPFDPIEIENIESDGQNMMVTFHDKSKRDRIIRSLRTKNLKSDKVLKLLPGEISTSVKAYEKATNFYKKLCGIAYAYVSKKRIYSYGITSQGLAIKLAPDSEIVYVRSKNELEAQVLRNDFKSSATSPSKRNKMD